MSVFEEENDRHVHTAVCINGGPDRIWTQTLVTFTGTRFLHSASSVHEESIPGLAFAEDELEAARAVFAMMRGRAPKTLTLAQLQKVLSTCRFFMADALVSAFAGYLEGIVPQLTADEVRLQSLRFLLSQLTAACVATLPQRSGIDAGFALSLCKYSFCCVTAQGKQLRMHPHQAGRAGANAVSLW